VFTLQSQRHGVGRSIGKTRVVFIDPGAKVNSSYYCNIVLEKGLLPVVRATCRHYKWTLQQDGAPAQIAQTTMDYRKKERINFIEPHMWPPYSPDINPVDYAMSLPPTAIHDGGITEAKVSHRLAKTLSVSLIKVGLSMNGVDVLKLLSRMAADTSSIATWLEQPYIILLLSRDKFSQ